MEVNIRVGNYSNRHICYHGYDRWPPHLSCNRVKSYAPPPPPPNLENRVDNQGDGVLQSGGPGISQVAPIQKKAPTYLRAVPGFPVGGDANPPGGAPTYDFAKNVSKNRMKLRKSWAIGAPP